MKRIILFLTIAVIALSGCKKDSLAKYDIEKSFADPSIKLEDFKKAIASGTDGFRLIITPSVGALVGGYIKFDATASAKILLDNSVVNATTPVDNVYSIKIIKTNSVLALGETSPFAVVARGIGGIDTTYSYKNTIGDTLKLVGDLLGTKLSLIKLAKKDGDEYLAGKMGQTIGAVNSLKSFAKYFKRLTTGGKSYDITFNTTAKTATFNYAKGTTFTSFSTPMIFINNGIEFTYPLVDGTNAIKSLNDLAVNLSNSSASLSVGASAAVLSNEAAPVAYDKTAAARFISSPTQGTYSESVSAFTISGVPDGLGAKTIPNFATIDFYPKVGTNAYGGFRFWLTSAYFGFYPAFTSVVTPDGKIIFTLLGYAGTATGNATRQVIINTANIIAQPEGFYIIPTANSTGVNSYDMVNVKDGSAWISFQ